MLDKLVESSNNNRKNQKLRGLLLVTSTLAISGIVFALIFSLFSQNLAMGSDRIDLSNLITPPRIVDEKPEPPEPKKKAETTTKKNVKSDQPTRVQNILRLDESPQKIPNDISSKPLTDKARPDSNFKIDAVDTDSQVVSSNFSNKNVSGSIKGSSFSENKPKEIEKIKNEVKEPVKKVPPPPIVEKPKKDVIVSTGVVNGKAKNLVMPTYSAAAKSAGVRGKVTVQVLISEDGKVLSANAIDGHPLLKRSAATAARKSTFTSTYLSKEKVKVRGVIVYNFN